MDHLHSRVLRGKAAFSHFSVVVLGKAFGVVVVLPKNSILPATSFGFRCQHFLPRFHYSSLYVSSQARSALRLLFLFLFEL